LSVDKKLLCETAIGQPDQLRLLLPMIRPTRPTLAEVPLADLSLGTTASASVGGRFRGRWFGAGDIDTRRVDGSVGVRNCRSRHRGGGGSTREL
jgi:hypothetical protein